MAGKATKSSIPTTSANKDLSCLRCRKKKAKCSKTRPTCTRCSRSNQPCEYPDAPPNLTDLSQKVLNLYDTLRELEGEFLVKYMQSKEEEEEEKEEANEQQEEEDITHNSPLPTEPIKKQVIEEPSGWSVSLTNNGLSIHTVTRNLSEYNEFAKIISRQIIRDFGENYLPKHWDPDAEGYFEEESDAEELDEDEYLVTVPIFSTCSILFNQDTPARLTSLKTEETELRRTLLGGDTLVSLIQSHFIHMLEHLEERYKFIEKQDTKLESHHIMILMLQLKSYLPIDYLTNKKKDPNEPLTQICILTAYVVSITLLAPIPNIVFPPLTKSLWRDCAEYATMLLIDFILIKGDTSCYPIILCSILLAWIDAEICNHSDTMIHIALRILCNNSDWQQQEPAWQILIATLLYLDIYSATFRFKKPQLCGEGITKLWKAAIHMREPKRWETTYRETGIVLEARLMSLLQKVISLFYKIDDTREINVRKIDVDEVLTLVRDVELWEQELPDWAKWKEVNKEGLVMHMHLIHNIVKILLFRPFCIINVEDEQTFTKSTFLDMSLSSADRLTTCLLHLHSGGYWTIAAYHLVKDVSKRVFNMFDKDEEIVKQLDKIKDRLNKLS